ncbi:MAG: FmdB family zinc ribbon protein [Desulfonatronovibrio sp.]
MPIFEYYCTRCKELFEELVMHPDKEQVCCPRCNDHRHTQKRVSAACRTRGSSDTDNAVSPASCSPGGFS